MRTDLSDSFGIDFALFAFNYQPDVVIEVCKAGGLGVLGAVRFTPAELKEALEYIEANIGGRPYGVDVVMPAKTEAVAGMEVGEMHKMLEDMIPQEHKEFVEKVLDQYAVPKLPEGEHAPRDLLSWNDTEAREQVSISLERPDVKLIVNALGPPPKDVVDEAHGAGVRVAALTGRKDHALKQVANGVDIIVAQGTEAGGHTGEISTMVLIPEVVDAVGPDTIVLAAGGIGRGRQMAAGLALGADGVWTGSIWLTVEEADTPEASRDRMLAATSRDTVRSRSWTGKPARMLKTAWTDAWESPESPGTLPMPMQFMLISDALARINRAGAGELTTFPVGQIVGTMNQVKPTSRVIYEMVEEYIETMERLGGLIED
jgi:NAD(P)H-dependent flavin oxidoreductase YrpB (nitropropane dioxygenase family)